MRSLSLALLPALFFEMGCGATLRAGGQFRTVPRGAPALEAHGTYGPALATDGVQLAVPVSVSGGARLSDGRPEGTLDLGFEFTGVDASGFGGRVGPRVGFGLAGTSGSYLGLRGGPLLMLAPICGVVARAASRSDWAVLAG